jgi:VCBS repeat-containing protein
MRADKELQRDVIEELGWKPSLKGEEIGVAVKNGVVTLSGEVSSYGQKYDAEHAVECINGVKGIAVDLNVKLPATSLHSDTEITHAVVDALRWDIQVPDDKIKVRVEDGHVTLEGDVEWQYQRQAAERAVRYLAGVKSVYNVIMVKPRKVSASNVTKKIKDAFKRSAEIDSSKVSVESVEGKVILKGIVRSWAERRDAENAAWSAPGVTQVDDRLAVSI